MRRALRLLPLFLLLALALGCETKPKPGGKRFEKLARTVVSLSPGTTEIVALGGGTSFLFGRTDRCDYPDFAYRYPVVVKNGKIDFEQIAKLKPKLAVYDGHLYSQSEIDKLKQLGVEAFAIKATTLEEFEEELFNLSKHYNAETTVSEYVDKIRAERRAAQSDPAEPTPRVAVVMGSSNGEHYIAGTKSFQADLVRAASGQPVGPESDRFVPINAEAFVRLNPDVIISAGDAGPVLKDPRLQSVAAVKNRRVVAVEPDFILRRGYRVPQAIKGLHVILSGGGK